MKIYRVAINVYENDIKEEVVFYYLNAQNANSQAKCFCEDVEEIETEDKAMTIYILTAYDASRDEHIDTYYLSQENAEAAAKALEAKGENAVICVVSTED